MKNTLFLIGMFLYSVPAVSSDSLMLQGKDLWGIQIPSVGYSDVTTPFPSLVSDTTININSGMTAVIPDTTILSEMPYFKYEPLMLDGGISFRVEDRTFAVKMGFLKGQYDDYVKTYKPKLVVFASDVTEFINGDDNHLFIQTMDIISGNSHEYSMSLNPLDNNSKRVEFGYSSGRITVFLMGQEELIAQWDLNELLKAWAKAAEKNVLQYNGKRIYAVPQVINDYMHDVDRFGYVLSEGSPLYHTTGLPLDFMEVCRHPKYQDLFSYKPVGYSIPLGIALEKRPEGGWLVRGIDSDELSAALDDEAADTSR